MRAARFPSAPRFKTAAPVANGKWVVKSGKSSTTVTVVETAMGHAVIAGRRSRELVSDWQIGEPIYRGRIDNRRITVQVERDGIG